MIFQHFGRLFLPGTLANVLCCLNELMVNFREESSGIGRHHRLEVPTGGQLAQFRFSFKSKQGEMHEKSRLFRTILPVSIFFMEAGPVGHPLEFEPAK